MPQKFYVAVREDAPFVAGDRAKTEAEQQRDKIAETLGTLFVEVQVGKLVGMAKITARFGTENGRADAFTLVGEDPMAEEMVRQVMQTPNGGELGSYGVAAVFEINDFLVAESLAWDVIFKQGVADRCTVYLYESEDDAPREGAYKSIEIYYDIDKIPSAFEHPLDFRNEAMELVENALMEADAGEWEGAEIGMGEVNFGFEVKDFDKAESIIRATVKGTPFEGIREISRHSDAGL